MRKSEKTGLSGEQSQVRGDVGNHGKQRWVQWHEIEDVWGVWFAENEAVFEAEVSTTGAQDQPEVLS